MRQLKRVGKAEVKQGKAGAKGDAGAIKEADAEVGHLTARRGLWRDFTGAQASEGRRVCRTTRQGNSPYLRLLLAGACADFARVSR